MTENREPGQTRRYPAKWIPSQELNAIGQGQA